MQRAALPPRFFAISDLVVLLLVASIIYGLVVIGDQWTGQFHSATKIDLSFRSLPHYTLLSAARGIAAYFVSLVFTLVVGYAAGKSRSAERILVPMIDILQCIPVLGFLPGLVLGLVSLFPSSNIGLEIAAILMIFTSQAWNMAFSFYFSVKTVPSDLSEVSRVMGMNWKLRLFRVELPFSAVGLVWNSLFSMAGGWFFLTVCEAFTLGDREFRLPGIGAYMAEAIAAGNAQAMAAGVVAMTLLIICMDFLFWRPLLAWVQKFRMEEVSEGPTDEPLMALVIRESRIVNWIKLAYSRIDQVRKERRRHQFEEEIVSDVLSLLPTSAHPRMIRARVKGIVSSRWFLKVAEMGFLTVATCLVLYAVYRLGLLLVSVPATIWMVLLRNTFWTFVRVALATVLSTLWAVPVGVWIGTSPKRIRVAQPIIQVIASFPAPMIYPLILTFLFWSGMNFDWASVFLMLLGVQWYVLSNVLAGALRIPAELVYSLKLMKASRWDTWKTLYFPSIFPSLVTGWVTAAGGAWNASIVAEYFFYNGKTLETGGLGATINVAAATQNFPLLAASLTLMVIVVVFLNRTVWAYCYELAESRYRMDG